MDYGYVPVTDVATRTLKELVGRRVPETKLRDAKTVRDFIEGLNTDSSIKPIGDVVIGAHAAGEGKLWVVLFPGQAGVDGKATTRTDYEHLEQTTAALRSIRIDDLTIGYTSGAPTNTVHLKGCNIGKATQFLIRLKQALGGHVLVTAPLHFQGVRAIGPDVGSFDYLCYQFKTKTPAVKKPDKSLRGFATYAELLTAMGNEGHHYISGPVPDADWKKWIPEKFQSSNSFYMALPLGRSVEGETELVIRPNKKKKVKGAHEYRVEKTGLTVPFVPPTTATTYDQRVDALKAGLLTQSVWQAGHPWPKYERAGFASLDDYMAGHLWIFPMGKGKATNGVRYEYTVVLPITDASGNLVYNYYPGSNGTDAAITDGFSSIGNNKFFASV